MRKRKTFLGYKNWRSLLRTYAIIGSFSVAGFLIRMAKFDLFGWNFQILLFFVQLLSVLIIWEGLRFIDRKLDEVFPYERSLGVRMTIQIVLGALVGALARACIYYFGEPYIPFRLDELFLAVTWFLYVVLPVGINLGFFTSYFIGRWKEGMLRNERLEKEKSRVQFDNLKNQMNPHFLFNALTSLNSLIFENQALASEFLQQLSKVYRYVLQNKERNFVTLQTELDFIHHYVQLLHTRFKEALLILIDIKPELGDKAIVPVTLQILIENALKHNVVDNTRPLRIDIVTVGDYLVVSNNLQPRKLVETSNKVGLENLKSLYRFLTDRPVLVEKTDERFAVKIPLV
ncbi:MAG: sensor histidine kinase [Bacteroidota bacterium]